MDLLIPDEATARRLLVEGGRMNPGPWVKHSLHAGEAARIIASRVEGMDPTAAFTLGALHDIGRRFGVSYYRHMVDGYRFLESLGYPDAARVCVTHSFQLRNAASLAAKNDSSPEETDFIRRFLDSVEFDEYDRLIQLCDLIAMEEGFCLMEKRLVDAALRHGTTPLTQEKWKACFDLKRHFEKMAGTASLYSLLPGVVRTTFGLDL